MKIHQAEYVQNPLVLKLNGVEVISDFGIYISIDEVLPRDFAVTQVVEDIGGESINRHWFKGNYFLAWMRYRTLLALARQGRWA